MLTQVSFFLWKVVVQTISNFFRIFCECIPQYIVLTSFQFQEMRNWIRKKLFGYSIKRKNFSLKRRRSTKMNYEVFVNKTLNLYHLKLYYTRVLENDFFTEFLIREAQREIVEETKAEYNPAAYGMNRAEEQVMQAYPAERYSDRSRYHYYFIFY